MSTTWIRVAYGAVLALVLTFTVLFGVAMVIPGPTPPGDPGITFRQLTTEDTDNSQNRLTASIDQYFADAKNFRDDFVNYQRNFVLAAAGLAARAHRHCPARGSELHALGLTGRRRPCPDLGRSYRIYADTKPGPARELSSGDGSGR
jgi:hypothetical protein